MKKEDGIMRISLIIIVLVIIGLIFLAIWGIVVAVDTMSLSNSGTSKVAKTEKKNNTITNEQNYEYSWKDNSDNKEEASQEEYNDYYNKTFGDYILTTTSELREVGFIYESDNNKLEIMFINAEWMNAEIGIKDAGFDKLVENKAEWKNKLENQGYQDVNPEKKTIGGVNYLITLLNDNGVYSIAAYAEGPKEDESFTILVTGAKDTVNYEIMEEVSKVILEIKLKNQGETGTQLDINSELVKDLHSKVLKFNNIYDFSSDEDYSFYKDKKITVNDLTNTEKVIAVIQYLEENNYGTKIELAKLNQETLKQLTMYVPPEYEGPVYGEVYDANILKSGLKLVFGDNAKIEWFSFDNNCAVAHDFIDGKYYKYVYPGGGYGYRKYGCSKIEKAIQDGEYIYVYDKFIYAEDFVAEDYMKYYANSAKTSVIATSNIDYGADALNIVYSDNLISKYEDKLNTYKHTFKKNSDGEYYWISTEIEN